MGICSVHAQRFGRGDIMTGRAEAIFISDLHLCAEHPATTQAFIDFLQRSVIGQTERLYILGDLFEYWVGDDDCDDPFNRHIIEVLRGLSDRGIALFFIAGNRDLLIGSEFARRTGMTILPDPYPERFREQTILLSHGDALCTDDTDYQAFRNMVREPKWQEAFLAKPLVERHAMLNDMRRQSESAKKQKSVEIMDVNVGAVEQLFRNSAENLLIHGHTHRPARHQLFIDGKPCERWVLPDWDVEIRPMRGGGLRLQGRDLQWMPLLSS